VVTAGLLQAEPLLLTELPTGSLGTHANLLVEDGTPLSLEEAQIRQHQDQFRPGKQPVLTHGIGSRPVWVHLELINPTDCPLPFRLVAGTTWIDRLNVFIIHDGHVSASWQTGDDSPEAYGLTPGIGYTFSPSFASGRSDLYLRVDTVDPLVLPLELLSEEQAVSNERSIHYLYGLIYGFLIALAAYNGMLFAGLGERSHLYYSLYLVSLILLNLAYTGHGYAWLWPNQPQLQRYVILTLMVAYSCCGLLFASRFLALAEHAPRVLRQVQLYVLSGVGLIGLCIVMGSQLGAALVAFVFMTLFALGMVLLGIITIRNDRVTGRYFLAAALCGMFGAATTPLAVWGWLPFTSLTFHALEFGVIIEATLLALALAYQMRHHQESSLRAEHLSRLDPLTGLYNRRGFLALVEPIWSLAVRNGRPLILIMLDIDYFKQVNDQHGHAAGDRVLVETADLLAKACRMGDILARWGGEEFILLLPETDLEQACLFAERVRQSIETRRLAIRPDTIAVTASFGVVERDQQFGLDELINEADKWLYRAKQSGRNRVSSAQAWLPTL
jgi:diguanylate cyclase (GGDEF)-like protein